MVKMKTAWNAEVPGGFFICLLLQILDAEDKRITLRGLRLQPEGLCRLAQR